MFRSYDHPQGTYIVPCQSYSLNNKCTHTHTHTHIYIYIYICIYIYYLRSLKFTLKHSKRSYMFRSHDHPQGTYIVPCQSYSLNNKYTHTHTQIYILFKKSKIYIKTLKTLLHVSIIDHDLGRYFVPCQS